MLNLEQQVSCVGDVSRLSISSQPDKFQKKNSSIQNPSTLNSEGAVLSHDYSNLKTEKVKNLRVRMKQIAKAQQAIDIRAKTYIDLIERQVNKKQQENNELESFIMKLKEEIMESRQDLQVLQNYINKKPVNVFKNDSLSVRSTSNNNTVKSSVKMIKKSKGNENEVKKIRTSPSNKLGKLQSSEARSPTSRNEKKNSLLGGYLISSVQQKTKSPFK